MYIALCCMFLGMILGRILYSYISQIVIQKSIMLVIFCLLFFLGMAIGKNDTLLAKLPIFGLTALVLCLFYIGGSILAQLILKKSGLVKFPPVKDNEK